MDKTPPLVAVVITTKNEEKNIGRCLDSKWEMENLIKTPDLNNRNVFPPILSGSKVFK